MYVKNAKTSEDEYAYWSFDDSNEYTHDIGSSMNQIHSWMLVLTTLVHASTRTYRAFYAADDDPTVLLEESLPYAGPVSYIYQIHETTRLSRANVCVSGGPSSLSSIRTTVKLATSKRRTHELKYARRIMITTYDTTARRSIPHVHR
jgi:hypothetical protein